MTDLVDFERQQTDSGWGEGLKNLGKVLGYPDQPPAGESGKHIKLHYEPRIRVGGSKNLTREESKRLREFILELAARPEGVRSWEVVELTGYGKQTIYYSLDRLFLRDRLLVREESTKFGNKQASKCYIFRLKRKGD